MATQDKKDLFNWLLNTKIVMDKNVVSSEVGEMIINKHLPLFSDFKERMEMLHQLFENGIHKYQLEFWFNHFFKDKKELVINLEMMMQNRFEHEEIINLVVRDFLKLSDDIRREFYKKNFTTLSPSIRGKNEVVTVCGTTDILWPKDFHHNVISLMLKKTSHFSANETLIESVIQDNKKLLSKDEFRQLVIPSLIIMKDFKYCKEHWHEWRIDNDKELQSLVAMKFLDKTKINVNSSSFLNAVESNQIPYDLALKNDKFLMAKCIKASISTIFSKMLERLWKLEEIKKPVEEAITVLKRASQYDLYFVDSNLFPEALKELDRIIALPQSNRSRYLDDPEMKKTLLDFSLVLSDLNSSVSAIKPKEKKLKI